MLGFVFEDFMQLSIWHGITATAHSCLQGQYLTAGPCNALKICGFQWHSSLFSSFFTVGRKLRDFALH